ncbi:MAG: hypothetical protein KAG28_01800 [Cocleimonas sp.]|nr:hypothetical protein [Cocleimonas sp.]
MKKRNRGVVFDKFKVRHYAQKQGIMTLIAFEIHYMRHFYIPENQTVGAPAKAWHGGKLDKRYALQIAELLALMDYLPLLKEDTLSSWANLVDHTDYHCKLMNFQLSSGEHHYLIDSDGFQHRSEKDLDEISITQDWCLSFTGQAGDHFFVVLQSQDLIFQLAPLDLENFISVMPKDETTLRYPAQKNFTFREQYGLGWRLCTVIRTSSLIMPPKSLKTGFTLTRQALDEFALRLAQDPQQHIAVDYYEFILVQ